MQEIIRVATWNIGSLYKDYTENVKHLRRILTDSRIDILCMQEVPRQESLLEDICTWGGFPYHVFHTTSVSHVFQGHDMGIAVFSRFPLGTPDVLKLTKPTVAVSHNGQQETWHDKFFMVVSCALDPQPMLVVTGHGFPFHRYDLEHPEHYHLIRPSFRELDAWLAGLAEQYGSPVLCAAADFNITDPMPFMPRSARQYRDVLRGQPTRPSGRKTDAILIPGSVTPGEIINISIRSDSGAALFDHNFVSSELHL